MLEAVVVRKHFCEIQESSKFATEKLKVQGKKFKLKSSEALEDGESSCWLVQLRCKGRAVFCFS